MSDALPKVTIVVPARPEQKHVLALNALKALEYPKTSMEILLARGRQPAVQRNAAVKEASGEFVYFLDDDAEAESGNIRRALERFVADPAVAMVGGPNLCPKQAPWLEQIFAVVLASWLALGPSRARYARVGQARRTGEKELILCNLMVRRSAFLDAGGFDESLYPNEENALMDTLQARGGVLFYDPDFVVKRRPRPTLGTFTRMLFRYGRGRAEQFRLHPTVGSAINFVPPLFCVYLMSLWALPQIVVITGLGAYALALLGQGIVSVAGGAGWKGAASLPLVVWTHICYGLGFWRGLFTRVKCSADARAEVTLEHPDLDGAQP